MKVNDVINNAPKKEYHCKNRCPLCGCDEFIVDDIYETAERGEHGEFIDTIDFDVECDACGARFTQRFKLGDYLKTIDVIPED